MPTEYPSEQHESLHQLAEKYSLDKNIVNQYAEEFAKLAERGVRDIKYDFVEGTTSQQRLEAALEVLQNINSGEFETVYEGDVFDALMNLDDIVANMDHGDKS